MSADYTNREYTVTSYNLEWPEEFKKLATRVKTIFGDDALDIHHIGSTAVPGMEGKPTIDVLVLVETPERVDSHASEMEREGFTDCGQFVMDQAHLYKERWGNTVLANIHIFPIDHPHVHEMLALRDYLRTHPEEVAAYSRFKTALYEKYPSDYAQYRKEKDAYMSSLLHRI